MQCTPQQNGPVKSAVAMIVKAGWTARLESNKIFPNVHLEGLKGVRDRVGMKQGLESVLWAAETFNRSASSTNVGIISLHEVFYGGRPPLPLLPFFQPAYHRAPQQRKTDPRA